ncbi:MAG: hypothetical protein K5872_20860 [Rhizobiaceae bacterium]|nr:hypothetical protein [Rhizobiaceae bacterium]MCV0408670.1 hypothetical protein [Rhizobiaceae bacterium]
MTRNAKSSLRFLLPAMMLVAAGCGTTIEEAVPVSAETGLPAGPIDTGTYPNLNIRPTAANRQFTAAERGSKSQQLTASRARVQGERGVSPTSTVSELNAMRKRPEAVRQEIEDSPRDDED